MSTLRVAYLVNIYPALSLGFVEREVEGLRGLGAEVSTFTIRPPVESELLTPSMRREARGTPVLLESKREVLSSTARLLRRSPATYAHALRLAARWGPSGVKGRLWQLFYLAEAARLHEEMESRGLTHVHSHFASNGADVARLVVAIGRHLDGPDSAWRWTLTMHGPTEFAAVEHFDLEAKVLDAHAVACISDFTRSQLMALLPYDVWDKFSVVRMSADTDRFRPVPGRERAGRVQVLYVGRLVPEKGAPVLLEAMSVLRTRGVDAGLRIAGVGPLERSLRRRIAELGLDDRTDMVGGVGQDDLPDLYASADVFCLPSFQEGLPVVLMEAMACGLPVVTTSIAGISELVDETNGRVVRPGRADLLADALEELVGSPDLRVGLGRAGRDRVEREYDARSAARSQLAFLTRAQE